MKFSCIVFCNPRVPFSLSLCVYRCTYLRASLRIVSATDLEAPKDYYSTLTVQCDLSPFLKNANRAGILAVELIWLFLLLISPDLETISTQTKFNLTTDFCTSCKERLIMSKVFSEVSGWFQGWSQWMCWGRWIQRKHAWLTVAIKDEQSLLLKSAVLGFLNNNQLGRVMLQVPWFKCLPKEKIYKAENFSQR